MELPLKARWISLQIFAGRRVHWSFIGHQGQKMVMMPYAYYREHLCTQNEVERVEENLKRLRRTEIN